MAISMFCEGGHFVLLPAHCAQAFGSSKRGVKAFSLLFSCFGTCSLSTGLISALLHNVASDPYLHMFQISMMLTLMALILLIHYSNFIDEEHKQRENYEKEQEMQWNQDDCFKRVNYDLKLQSCQNMALLVTPKDSIFAKNLKPVNSDTVSITSETTQNTLEANRARYL